LPLDVDTQLFLEKSRSQSGPAPSEVSLEDFRTAIEAFRGLGFDHEEVARVEDISIPREGFEDVAVRLYRPSVEKPEPPAEEKPLPVCVWVHGGSWVRVTVDHVDGYFRHTANQSGCAIAAVDYRLSPESQYPEAIEEIYHAARWLKLRAKELGLDESRIGLAGESSGGNVAAAAALIDRRRRLVDFAYQVLVLPILDLRFETDSWRELGDDYLLTRSQIEWAIEQYAPGADRDDPLLSPLRATLEDLEGMPPTRIVTGEYDPLKDEGAAFAERLREAGVEVDLVEMAGLIHHAVAVPKLLPKGRTLAADNAAAVGAALGDGNHG
jgi:acetyl esterase/lipase